MISPTGFCGIMLRDRGGHALLLYTYNSDTIISAYNISFLNPLLYIGLARACLNEQIISNIDGNRNYGKRNNNPQTTTFMRWGVDTIFEWGRVNDDNNFRQLHIGTRVDCSQISSYMFLSLFFFCILYTYENNINSVFDS
jgi:hypothetical protein